MLTVLLATKNRAALLRDVLEAYCLIEAPASGWKLVVVDNGSTDDTPQVVDSFSSRLPIHFILETKPGKNFALNTGLALAEGDLTVLTDDDAFPHPDWLIKLRAAADAQPAYTMFGGVVVPRWEVPPPAWIQWIKEPGPVFTLSNSSLPDGPVDPSEIYGPNMAIRSDVFRAGLRFDPTIGPRGTSYPMGSETELLLRLGRNGHKAWHVRGAIVEHFIRKEQLERTWVLQRAIRFGRGQYRLFTAETPANSWLGMPSALPRKMFKQAAVMVAGWITFRPETVFRAHWRLNIFRGQAMEARNVAQERHPLAPPVSEAARRKS